MSVYIIEKVQDERKNLLGESYILVKWQNYSPYYNTWVPRTELRPVEIDDDSASLCDSPGTPDINTLNTSPDASASVDLFPSVPGVCVLDFIARWAFILVGTSAINRLLTERAQRARFYTRQVNIRGFSRKFHLARGYPECRVTTPDRLYPV